MAESTIMKTLNGRKVYDEDARKELENIKNAAPGLVFDTVADMEAYIAENAGRLKVGQDLLIRAADAPDYWWDGTQAVPVETDLSKVKQELDELTKSIPKVFDWANAELPFTVSEISGVTSGGGFVVNPTNYADGKPYFRYNAGSSYGFRWTNPNPQKGSLTITMRGYSQYSETLSTKIVTVYTDGTDNSLTDMMYLTHGNTVTYTTDPEKTVDYIRGNYDFENWVLLDMDVLSIVADYPMPTDLGITGAAVGQTVKITEVDEDGKPTKWEAVDSGSGGTSDAVQFIPQELTEEQQMQARENMGLYRKTVVLDREAEVSVEKMSEQEATISGLEIISASNGGTWRDGDTIRVEIGNYTFEGTVTLGVLYPGEYGVYADLVIPINSWAKYRLKYMPYEQTWTMTGDYSFTLEDAETMRVYKVEMSPVPEEYIPDTIARVEDIPARTDIDSTLSIEGAAADAKAVGEKVYEITKSIADKVSKTGITLGLYSDGKYYIFVDGAPVGTGFELSGASGDVFGYVDENNNIVLNGNLADGSYNIKYEMEDGSTVDIGELVLDTNVYYSVTNNLTNCVSSNSDTQAIGGQAYAATITANSGYELSSVVVTMGGNPVSVSGGSINIAEVSGDIVITAVAESAEPSYTNLLPLAVDANDNDFVGANGEKGYKTGYRINSSGTEVVASDVKCTGYMPYTNQSDKIYIKDIVLSSNENNNNMVFYDASKVIIKNIYMHEANAAFELNDNVWTITPNKQVNLPNVAFFRFCAGTISDNTIVTVNEEIV